MEIAAVEMDGTLRGLMPCDILGKPWISELNGCCGVGANFRRALQRFRKFTTYAVNYAFDAASGRFINAAYSGNASIIFSGEGDPITQNGYIAGSLSSANLTRFQTNLSQGGRPCPTTPESMFVLTAIQAIAEPTQWRTADGTQPRLTGAEFLSANRYAEYFQHQTLRSSAVTYRYDADGCDADLDPWRFFPSEYGKPSLDHASHNGIAMKGNVQCLPAWVPIVQSQNDGQPNISKLNLTVDTGIGASASAISPGPVANANLVITQEVTIVMSGFCVPREVGLWMCDRQGIQKARAWFRSNAFATPLGWDPNGGNGQQPVK
jgi:hypothetical protein